MLKDSPQDKQNTVEALSDYSCKHLIILSVPNMHWLLLKPGYPPWHLHPFSELITMESFGVSLIIL